jgi:hypothetical protein
MSSSQKVTENRLINIACRTAGVTSLCIYVSDVFFVSGHYQDLLGTDSFGNFLEDDILPFFLRSLNIVCTEILPCVP